MTATEKARTGPGGVVRRWPRARLRPFVSLLWAHDRRAFPAPPAGAERVLPTGEMHLAIRLSGDPLRLIDLADPSHVTTVGSAVLGGGRQEPYGREIAGPAWSVGAQIRPGAAGVLFGAPAGIFSGGHTALDLVWGPDVDRLRARLAEADGPDAQLDILESALAARLPAAPAIHPAIARALLSFRSSPEISAAVAASGVGHRRFIELFREHVGLTPKVFCRVRRFQRALRAASRDPAQSWAAIAAAAGYSDQPHLHRDFVAFAGVTPGEYRALRPEFSNHVALDLPRAPRR